MDFVWCMELIARVTYARSKVNIVLWWGRGQWDSLGLHNGTVHSIYHLLAVLSLTFGTPELLGQLTEVYLIPAPAGRLFEGLLTQHWLSGW